MLSFCYPFGRLVSRCSLAVGGLGLACALVAAPMRQPGPGEGTVNASGKYIPNDPSLRPGMTPPANPKAPTAADLPAPRIEKQADGTMRIGRVTVDPKERTISFPAAVNAHAGLIEYALVTKTGKVHESLLNTDIAPLDLHVAALLLNLAPSQDASVYARVLIEVEWETNGPKRRELLEDMIKLAQDGQFGREGATLAAVGWNYAGSFLQGGVLAADREGSIITLIGDPVALLGNPRPDRVNDKVHVPNPARMPSLGMPVTVRLRLAPNASAQR